MFRPAMDSLLLYPLVGSIHILLIFLLSPVASQPASLSFDDCFTGPNVSQKLQVSTVYAQIIDNDYLDIIVLGNTPVEIIPASNGTDNPVATTLFTTTDMLTFTVWSNHSYFCSTLRPGSPLPTLTNSTSYCPLQPGPFAFSSIVNLPHTYELSTFNTRLRALDPYTTELFCIDVATTPLKPGTTHAVYGNAVIIFWITIALAIGYWLVVGSARIVSAWGRGIGRSTPGLWRRVESAGFILASALSGDRLATSPALLRFCTPSLRDIIFHTQWCASLSMVAVQWPQFVYPLSSQTAWSMLSYNITIGQDSARWNPLYVPPYNPPSAFADQLSDSNSPLFIDDTVPNMLFMFPPNVTTGIPAFAAAVGLYPADLFAITLILFLCICGVAIVVSIIAWGIDELATVVGRTLGNTGSQSIGARSPHATSTSKDRLDNAAQSPQLPDETRSLNNNFFLRNSRFAIPSRWRLRPGLGSFHGSVLQGNLVRVLVLFHFPVTIFSCYQMTLGRPQASLTSIVLATFSFTFLSVLVPFALLLRLYATNTSKLYDETWTLLALGPLYNHYRHGSQLFACLLFATNLAFGVTIGCGQKNGTVQVIIILVIEVVSALGTSFWLPWGQGASMGLISFLFCVARIVIAVLMVILAPIVSIGDGAGQWVAYAILAILGLVYLAFILMLVVKVIEALVRIFGGVGFHKSRHAVDSGLFGASGLAGCCGSKKRQRPRHRTRTLEVPQATSSKLSLSHPPVQNPQVGTPTNSSPPSVLRPEHAFQPYREESDDENGFIMGAWHSFPRQGYTAVGDQPSPDPPKSGFMRVGGGRSHYDTPYAIQAGSTATFPSAERPSTLNSRPRRLSSPSPTLAINDDVFQCLPPGAMPPVHVRANSQAAVIENAPVPMTLTPDKPRFKPPPVHRVSDDDLSMELAKPKRKPWFQIRKNRYSEGELPQMTNPEPAAEVPTPGRSFVVVRKGQSNVVSNSDAVASGSGSGGGEQAAPKSFVVLRE